MRRAGARVAILAAALAGICARARAAGPWTPVGPPGGAVYSLAVDPKQPSNLYVGAFGGGVWKSTDAGATWKRLSGVPIQQSVNAVAVAPSRPPAVFAGTYDAGIWRSLDGGLSWKRVFRAEHIQAQIMAILVDPAQPRVVYAGTDSQGFPNGVLKSEDGGATWKPANEGLPKDPRVYGLAADPKSPGVLYAGTTEGVYMSKDSARGWSALAGPHSDEWVQSLAAHGGAVVAGALSEGIFWSGDGGGTWAKAQTDTDLAGDRIYALVSDPAQPGTFYAGIPNRILRSTDGGRRWSSITEGFNWINFRSLALDPAGGATIYAGSGRDGVLKTTDAGKTWASSTGFYAFDVTSVLADPETPGRIVVGTTQGGIHLSEDGGRTWALSNEGLKDRAVLSLAFDPKNSRAILSGTREGIYRSTDGGKAWSQVARGGSLEAQEMGFAADSKRVYARDESTVWRSDDAGATWKEMRPSLESEGSLGGRFALASASSSADVVLANNHRKLFRSTDGAKTWTVVAGIPQTMRIQQNVADTGDVLFAATEEGIYRSSDGGASWTVAGKGAETADVQTILIDRSSPGTIYAGTWKTGILRTTDGGKTWSRIGGDPPHPDMRSSMTRKTWLCALLVVSGTAGLARAQVGSQADNWTMPEWSSKAVDISRPVTFVAVTPCRIVDTRDPAGPYGGPILPANTVRDFDLNSGPCTEIPAGVAAYSLNFTATQTQGFGDLRVWPTGSTPPLVSTLNYVPNQTVANAAIVPANDAGSISVVAAVSGTHLIIDINGYFTNRPNPGNTWRFEVFAASAGLGVTNHETAALLSHGVHGLASSSGRGSSGVFGENFAAGEVNGVWGRSGGPLFFSTTPLYGAAAVRGESASSFGVLGITRTGLGVAGSNIDSVGAETAWGGLACADTQAVCGLGTLNVSGSKSFVEPHPTDASRVIKFVSLEGNEAGTYFRGRGKFERGQARIAVPEGFRMVTAEEGLSIQVTPIGEMATFAVVRIDLDGIIVKASRNVEFFFLVHGVRRGYEDFTPIVEEPFFVPRSAEYRMPGGLSAEAKRKLIANGTYNADGTVNMDTAKRLGWTEKWKDSAEKD